MRARVTLTDRFISSPRRVPKQGRERFWDAQVPTLNVCVTHMGHRSFMLTQRYPLDPKHSTHRLLGEVGTITLDAARAKARAWIALIKRGIDPKVQELRDKAEAQRQQHNTFAMLWSEFETHHANKLAKADEARRAGKAFVRLWGPRPASEILSEEIATHIRAVAKQTPSEARNRLGHLRRMYSWAIGSGGFGITSNPCAVLKPADLIGAKVNRNRILTDAELLAVWRAADGVVDVSALAEARKRSGDREVNRPLGYPYGPLVRLLILTAQRLNEIAALPWSEIDFDKKLITIPAERMKGERAHEVPLAPMALELLQSLPRIGPFVFSTNGKGPVNGFSKMKDRIDALSGVQDWVLHDLRRTTRTHFSALPVSDLVRELVIAHAKPGLR